MTSTDEAYRLFTIPDVQRALGVSRATVERILRDRTLAYLKIRGQVRVRPEDLDAYILGQMIPVEAPRFAPASPEKPPRKRTSPRLVPPVPRGRIGGGRSLAERLA